MTTPRAPRSDDGPPAVILGDDAINALGIARNLGRNGVEVHRLGTADPQVLRSRYIRSTRIVPGLDDCEDGVFVEALLEAVRRLDGKPVLFPISDLHVLNVARNASRLENEIRLLACGRQATETLVNKRRFYESLAAAEVPHPSTRFPRDRDGFVEAAEEIGFPVFLKPEISPLFARRFRRKGFVSNDVDELLHHLESLAPSGLAIMIQEIIPGDATCMHGCAGLRNETASVVVCYRRVREFPGGFGCGSLLESVASFADRTGLLAYLEGIGYTGIFDAEFKLDPRDGVYKVIEVNARSWWQNTLPSVSGCNIIKTAYDHAAGRPIEVGGYRCGAKWIHLYNDFFAARKAGLGPAAWLRSLRGERAFDVWAADDPWPMVAYASDIARRKMSMILGLAPGDL